MSFACTCGKPAKPSPTDVSFYPIRSLAPSYRTCTKSWRRTTTRSCVKSISPRSWSSPWSSATYSFCTHPIEWLHPFLALGRRTAQGALRVDHFQRVEKENGHAAEGYIREHGTPLGGAHARRRNCRLSPPSRGRKRFQEQRKTLCKIQASIGRRNSAGYSKSKRKQEDNSAAGRQG